ncbi:hypothetical protein LTS18_008422, partial [Coniosporium uncinatum]
YLLALKCLLAAHSIDPENPILHAQLIRFKQTLDSLPKEDALPSKADEVVKATAEAILPQGDLTKFNDDFLSKHSKSAAHTRSALIARLLLDKSSQANNEKELTLTLDLDDVTIADALAGLANLKSWKSDSKVQEEYLEKAKKRWPEASVFGA